MLVFYRGQVGYAPTISQALSQVGINSDAAQDIEVVGDSAPETGQDSAVDEQQAAPGNRDEALQKIDDALRGLESARNGSFEEYGRALDSLDKAVSDYQSVQ